MLGFRFRVHAASLRTRVIPVWLSTIIYEFIYELSSVCMGNSYINSYIIVDSPSRLYENVP